MWASFVDLHDETAALDCFAELVIGPATSGRTRWLAMTTTKRKKEAERRQTCSANLRALRARRAPLSLSPLPLAGEGREGARSPIGVPPRLLPSGLSALGRNSRPGFHGTRQDVRSYKLAPTGEQRSCALTRALPAPACPSPGNAPPGPVIVPVSMMPEAARVRSVSFRARAPHSLHLSEYLRDRRPR